jgi:tRNA(Ile)-lysidine synthetase-like protein
MAARPGAMPRISFPGYSIRLYDRRLFLVRDDELRSCCGVFCFDLEPLLEIECCNISLSRAQVFEQLQLNDDNQRLSICFRSDNHHGADRHRLKRLFQKMRVPPWQRDATPLVYLDNDLRGLLR